MIVLYIYFKKMIDIQKSVAVGDVAVGGVAVGGDSVTVSERNNKKKLETFDEM